MQNGPLEIFQQKRVRRTPIEKVISAEDEKTIKNYKSHKEIIHHEVALAGVTNKMFTKPRGCRMSILKEVKEKTETIMKEKYMS